MANVCYHCGSESGDFVQFDGKEFCCRGCATVYNILKDNKLYTYYKLEPTPGVKKQDTPGSDNYAYLDQEEIKVSVLDFYEDPIGKICLVIPAIHCSSCIWLLENLHRLNEGILTSTVNFVRKEVQITYDEKKIRLSGVMHLLESLHYKPVIRNKKQHMPKKTNSRLILKLGIAGFAFGNVMLLSFPEYLSQTISSSEQYLRYFGWLSLVLSLPVLLYSASDYFLSAWKNILKKLISIDLPIAIGILTIFLRSCFELAAGVGNGYFDSLTGLVFFLLIGKWYQDKTYRVLSFDNNYTSYFPLGITRITESGEEIIPIQRLHVGDKISVRNNEIVPADSILESDQALIDFSFITGESMPVKKEKGNRIYAGGRLLGTSVTLIVEREVKTSYLATLWKERSIPDGSKSFTSEMLDKVARYFTLIILMIAAVTALFWYLTDSSLVLSAFTSVLIVACPCALALSVPFTLGHAQLLLGRKGLFLKHSSVVEKLSKIDTVVLDKTGTLTDTSSFDVELDKELKDSLLLPGVRSLARQSFHPLSRAIASGPETEPDMKVFDFEEFEGRGLRGKVNDHRIQIGSADFLGYQKKSLADSSSEVFVKVDGKYIGGFRIRNHYRPDWEKLLGNLDTNYDLHLLSGDNDTEREKIEKLVEKKEQFNFNQTPEQKLNYIRNLRSKSKNVLMVGDGLNDSGALYESDIGMSVASDVYQFSPASDAIIKADSLIFLGKFLQFTKSTRKVIWTSFIFSFLYNIIGIWYASSGKLSPLIAAILMPLSSVTIVILTTFLTHYFGRNLKWNNS
jgi:Cu+-exporting ATPase